MCSSSSNGISSCRTCTTSTALSALPCPAIYCPVFLQQPLTFVPGLAASVITTCFYAARCVAALLNLRFVYIASRYSHSVLVLSHPLLGTLLTQSLNHSVTFYALGTMAMAITASNLEPNSSLQPKLDAQSLNGLAIW